MNRLSIETRLRIVCALAARGFALCFVSAVLDLARGASLRRFQVVPNPTALEDALQPSAHFSCATFATTVPSRDALPTDPSVQNRVRLAGGPRHS